MIDKNEIESNKNTIKKSDPVEVGSLRDHVEAIKKGMFEYKIWNSITYAIVQCAFPNENNRIDLRNIEQIEKIEKELNMKNEKELNMKVNYKDIENQIKIHPWLILPNGYKESNDNVVKPKKEITKKQEKINTKKEKLKNKSNKLQEKLNAIKNKECDRAKKLQQEIKELEIKVDRL